MAITSRNMMIERAHEFHVLAVQRRNRGLHTGTSAKGWNWERPKDAADDWESLARRTIKAWQVEARECLNDFQRAAFNGPGSDVDAYAIPF